MNGFNRFIQFIKNLLVTFFLSGRPHPTAVSAPAAACPLLLLTFRLAVIRISRSVRSGSGKHTAVLLVFVFKVELPDRFVLLLEPLSVGLGITLLLAFNEEPMLLSGTAIIIIISLVIRRLPYTLRSSSAILYQLSPSLEEASISLGASPVKTFFKVTAVMMLPGVMSGAIISWITAINELSSSVILFTGATKTMSVAIYTEVIRASYGTAAALSTILTLTTITAMVIFFKVSGRRDVTL